MRGPDKSRIPRSHECVTGRGLLRRTTYINRGRARRSCGSTLAHGGSHVSRRTPFLRHASTSPGPRATPRGLHDHANDVVQRQRDRTCAHHRRHNALGTRNSILATWRIDHERHAVRNRTTGPGDRGHGQHCPSVGSKGFPGANRWIGCRVGSRRRCLGWDPRVWNQLQAVRRGIILTGRIPSPGHDGR